MSPPRTALRPACERCGGRCATSRSVRCQQCTRLCRRCDVPIEGRGKKSYFCSTCILICRGCDGPTRVSGSKISSYCTGCIYRLMRETGEKAKDALGRCCARCGITHPLQWDHINEDPRRRDCDKRNKKRAGTLQTDYAEIARIARGEPSARLQLLCANCNWLKEFDPMSYLEPATYGPVGVPCLAT